MKTSTSSNYRQRLTQVVDFIHDNLEGDLSVNTLADIAIMSPYHFHRIYREMAQETLNATIRRLRLQRAAAELIRSDTPIANIAKQVSYGSIEAFSRAFTKQFGDTPSSYREQKKAIDISLEPFVAMLPTREKEYHDMFTVEIIDIEKTPLYGYPHKGDYMEIGSVFEKLFIYAGSNGLLDDKTRSIGLYFDDPQSVAADQLRSMACVTSTNPVDPSSDGAPEATEIPAGKCATLTFKGSYAELEKPYNWFFGEWLPNSGYETADHPPFEEYLNDPKDTPPSELLTRIHCLLA